MNNSFKIAPSNILVNKAHLTRAMLSICTDFWIQNSRLSPDVFPKQ